MKKYFLFLFLGTAIALTSCNDDDEKVVITPQNNTPTTPDNTPKINYVLAKTWHITGFTQGVPGSAVQSDLYTSGFPNCQKDDVYRFSTPDALTISPGNNQCTTGETDKTGTWDLNNSSTEFTINNPSQNISALKGKFTVIEITASKMIMSQVVNGDQYTVTFSAL